MHPDNWDNGLPDPTTRAYIDNGGTVQMTIGIGRTRYLHLGYEGSGSMEQSGGTLRINERAFIGHEIGDNGRYELGDGNFIALGGMLLGVDGTGDFIQTGGMAEIGGLWIAGYYNNGSGSGKYQQTGGVNNADILIYKNGSYELSGSAVLNSDFVGAYGSFTQTGGTANVARISSCGYSISDGLLEVGELEVAKDPNYGPGNFVQDGSNSTVNVNEKLSVIQGEYVLDSGTLTVNGQEHVGVDGVFKQSGGTHIVDDLSVSTYSGYTSRFELSGGDLQVRRSIVLEDGQLSFPEPGGTVKLDDNASADFARGTITDAANATVKGGEHSLMVFPSGFDPNTEFGSFTNPGLTHIAGSPLSVRSGKSVHFVGDLDDPVTCEGSLVGSFNVNNGLVVRGGGYVDAGYGSIRIRDHASRIEGGSIIADELRVGHGSSATFRHLGGTVSIADDLIIDTVGDNREDPIPSGVATYELGPSGVLKSRVTWIARKGSTAGFVQTGGIHMTDGIYLYGRSSYDMSGGVLQVPFMHLGGTETTFSMTGGSVRAADTILIGAHGSKTSFIQEGGSLEANKLFIASSTNNETEGRYSISGGTLLVGDLELGVKTAEGYLEVFGAEATIMVTGEFRQDALGTLLSIVGPDGLSAIECSTAVLAGTLSVLDNDAVLGRFSVLHATEGISGTFSLIDLPSPDWSWGIDGGTTVWVENVPEPGTLCLLTLGGLGILRRRSRLRLRPAGRQAGYDEAGPASKTPQVSGQHVFQLPPATAGGNL